MQYEFCRHVDLLSAFPKWIGTGRRDWRLPASKAARSAHAFRLREPRRCRLAFRHWDAFLPAYSHYPPGELPPSWITAFVTILALCNMRSADMAVSVSNFSKWIEKGGGGSARGVLFVRCGSNGNGDCVLGKFRGRCTMHHRVRILDANPVRSIVGLHDVHHGVVGPAVGPIALPFEHDLEGRDRPCAGLHDALHRVVVSKLGHVAAAILHDVDFVAVMKRLDGRKRNADLCPKAGDDNLLTSAFFDRGDKVLVVPRVHGRTLDG